MNLKKVYKSKIEDSSCTWRFKVCDPQSGDCIDQDITASNGKQALLDLYAGLPESYEVINMQCISGDPIAYMKKSDCAACGATGLTGAANVDGNAITTEADMGPMVPGGLKKKKKTGDAAYSNPGDRPQRAQFKSDADYQRALSRWEYALQQHVDRPCDSKIKDDSDTFAYDSALQEAILLIGFEWRYLQNGDTLNEQDATDLEEAVGMLEGIVHMNSRIRSAINLVNEEVSHIRNEESVDSEHLGRAIAILKQCALMAPYLGVSDSKIEDSAHTWKVYYLDTQRQRTNCIFVKAFSFFEAISIAEEKLPNYCTVQSATDTTPFAEDDEDEDED